MALELSEIWPMHKKMAGSVTFVMAASAALE